MSRTWCSCGVCFAVWTAVCLAAAEPPSAARPVAVDGVMVDSGVPATYRLPLVPAPEPPVDTIRLAERPAANPADKCEELPVAVAEKPAPPAARPIVPAPTTTTAQLLPAVQRGYALAQRGALFAARTEFIQVLRRVAQAQDSAAGTDEHARALAAGLRAIDEAEDFVPDGIQMEAELDVRVAASSHRTPALRDYAGKVLPHEAVGMYHEFAQQQLAQVAAGNQAGSMALYGLGRVYSQMSERRDDDVQFVRGAMTMYASAFDAREDNHLAANELGVLMCRTGRADEAARLFERAIDVAPSATVYHNLAVAQQQLGFQGEAFANEQEAQRLAAWERSQGAVSRRAGIQWVTPGEMARVAQPAAVTPSAMAAANPSPQMDSQAGIEPPKSRWERTKNLTRLLPRPGSGAAKHGPPSEPEARLAQPQVPASGPQWR